MEAGRKLEVPVAFAPHAKKKSLENTMFSRLFFFHKRHKATGFFRLRPNQLYPLAILILA